MKNPAPFLLALALLAATGSAAVPPTGGAGVPPAEAAPDGGPSTPRPLPPQPFMGWSEAYVLSNAHIHAVVVPAISRLAFLAPSADAPNLLRLDPALAAAGATPPDPSTAPDFFNIGGDWVWPVPQSLWPSIPVDGAPYGRDWPPPPPLADAPSTAEAWLDPEGNQLVRLTRHYPAPVSATLTREFILVDNRFPTFVCLQSLTRDPDAPPDAPPLSLWHISQVAAPEAIRFDVPSESFSPTVMAGTLPPGSLAIRGVRHKNTKGAVFLSCPGYSTGPDYMTWHATYTPPPSSEVKLLLPNPSFSASTPHGRFFVSASTPPNTQIDETLQNIGNDIVLSIHDIPPSHGELYSNTGLGYAELETVTPDAAPPFPSLSNTLHYSVHPPEAAEPPPPAPASPSTGGAGVPPAEPPLATPARAFLTPSPDAPGPAATPFLLETRGQADAQRLLDRLGLPSHDFYHPEEIPLRDFFLSRNLHTLYAGPFIGTGAFVQSFAPGDLDAYLALYAAASWSNAPLTPEGFQPVVPPSRAFTNYHVSAQGKFLESESPDALQTARDLLPSLPDTLSADGTLAARFSGAGVASLLSIGDPLRQVLADNLATLDLGLSLDGDFATLHAVFAPVPGSALDSAIPACGPVSPASEFINLPGIQNFFSVGPEPDLPEVFPDDPLAAALAPFAPHIANQPASAALYPPSIPAAGRFPFSRLLLCQALSNPYAARSDLLDRLSRHPDAVSVVSETLQSGKDGLDTVSIVSPDALARLLAARLGINSAILLPHLHYLADANATLSLAWTPPFLFAALDDPGAPLLRQAVENCDMAIHGYPADPPPPPFEKSPDFLAAFPDLDAPPHALVHLDLAALRNIHHVFSALPRPCPVDLCATVAPDNTLSLRLRLPVPLLRTLTALFLGLPPPGNPDIPPAEGAGAQPPSFAPPAPATGGAGVPPAEPSPAPPFLYETRGESTVQSALASLGLAPRTAYHPEEAPLRDFLLSRDLPSLCIQAPGDRCAFAYPLPPADANALFARLEESGWSRQPPTPDGLLPFSPPSRAFTDFFAQAGDRLFASESPDALRYARSLPSLPQSLPADGTLVEQYTGEAFAIAAASVYEASLGPAVAENLDSVVVGLDADAGGSAALLHAVFTPVPGSELDAWVKAYLPPPPTPEELARFKAGLGGIRMPAFILNEARCVDPKGRAIATVALAGLPLLPDFLREVLPPGLPERIARRTFSFSLLPPAVDSRTVSALFYAWSFDPSRSFRTLDAWFPGRLLTNRPVSTTVLFAPDLPPYRAISEFDFVRWFLSDPAAAWRFAPLPQAIFAARNAPDDAIDASIDFIHFNELAIWDASHFRALSPKLAHIPRDSTPVAVLHAELRDLLKAHPSVGPILRPFLARRLRGDVADAPPLPLDALLFVRQDGKIELRLRCPPPACLPVTCLRMAALRTYPFRQNTRLLGPPARGATVPSATPRPRPGSAGLPLASGG